MSTQKINFTAKVIAALDYSPTSKRVQYKDHGGPQSRRELYLFVGKESKAFYFVRDIAGKTVRHKIGTSPATTIEQARKRCSDLAADADKGINPVEQKRNSRQKGLSLGQAFEQYIDYATSRAKKPIRQSTVDGYRRSMTLHLPHWKSTPCKQIQFEDVDTWYAKTAKQSPTAANSALRIGRAVFSYQVALSTRQQSDAFTHNPFTGHALIEEKSRTECIEYGDLADWFGALERLQSETTRDYLTLLLFTGLRRREASTLKWSDIDLRKKTLTAKDTKNGSDHTLPLPTIVLELLVRRKIDATTQWVFSGSGKHGHIAEPKKAISRIADLSGVKCSPHGLRRTFSNIAAFKARVPESVRKILMNHAADRRDVTATHYTTLPLEELRPFIQSICNEILVGANREKPTAKVYTLELTG